LLEIENKFLPSLSATAIWSFDSLLLKNREENTLNQQITLGLFPYFGESCDLFKSQLT